MMNELQISTIANQIPIARKQQMLMARNRRAIARNRVPMTRNRVPMARNQQIRTYQRLPERSPIVIVHQASIPNSILI
ncbi:MAG: hypothetical protein F6J93_21085 [Oscillatoria sp. SIO1A7]|nr:hypothetical protein [Oscillatoria sp. SIO1A7]